MRAVAGRGIQAIKRQGDHHERLKTKESPSRANKNQRLGNKATPKKTRSAVESRGKDSNTPPEAPNRDQGKGPKVAKKGSIGSAGFFGVPRPGRFRGCLFWRGRGGFERGQGW